MDMFQGRYRPLLPFSYVGTAASSALSQERDTILLIFTKDRGLEVPCILKFIGEPKDAMKVKKLLSLPQKPQVDEKLRELKVDVGGKIKLSKKMKVEEAVHAFVKEKPAAGPSMRMGSEDAIDLEETVAPVNLTKPWITYDRQVLTLLDKALIVNRDELTDKHINFAQALLKQQYDISGLWSSLLLSTMSSPVTTPALQIMHCQVIISLW